MGSQIAGTPTPFFYFYFFESITVRFGDPRLFTAVETPHLLSEGLARFVLHLS